MFKIKIIKLERNISLFSITISVSIFGKNPRNGGIPAILKKMIIIDILLILLFLLIDILWKMKFMFKNFIVFVAKKVM